MMKKVILLMAVLGLGVLSPAAPVFFDDFNAILDAPFVDMLDRFVTLTKTQEIDPGSFDDITMVGMQIKTESAI